VIFCRSFNCRTAALTNAAPTNSLEQLKKSRFDLDNTRCFAGVRLLITSQNRFARQENSPNARGTRLLPTPRNSRRTGALVTTSHLFWPNQRRKAVLLLRNWQPNPANSRCRACKRAASRGAGDQRRKPGQGPRPKSAHGIFCLMDPLLCSAASKKRRQAPTPVARM
jgi:hypothetical protein